MEILVGGGMEGLIDWDARRATGTMDCRAASDSHRGQAARSSFRPSRGGCRVVLPLVLETAQLIGTNRAQRHCCDAVVVLTPGKSLALGLLAWELGTGASTGLIPSPAGSPLCVRCPPCTRLGRPSNLARKPGISWRYCPRHPGT